MSLVPLITPPWKVSLAFPNEVMEFSKTKVPINQPNVTLGQSGLKVGPSLQDFSRRARAEKPTFSAPNQVFSDRFCLVAAATYILFT